VAICGRQAEEKCLETAWTDSRKNEGIGCSEQGFAETRVPFCWFDDLLCVHAGDRYGERPRRRMLPLPPDCKALRKDFDVDDVEGLRPCAANAMSVGLALRLVESNLSGNDRGWRAPIAAHQLGMRFVAAQRDA